VLRSLNWPCAIFSESELATTARELRAAMGIGAGVSLLLLDDIESEGSR
jgi:hypothetical protein